jgi:hypothetical protein
MFGLATGEAKFGVPILAGGVGVTEALPMSMPSTLASAPGSKPQPFGGATWERHWLCSPIFVADPFQTQSTRARTCLFAGLVPIGGLLLSVTSQMRYVRNRSPGCTSTRSNGGLPVDGFKTELTNNGQGADVYKHIYGVAGAVLIGDSHAIASGVPGRGGLTGYQNIQRQLSEDMDQAAHGGKESETEVRDDYAGIAVGGAMLKANKERSRPEALRNTLLDILCSH